MTTSPLLELKKFGQSIWLDNLTRGLIKSGELERLIRENGVSGITSNPTIFDKAITQSNDYDEVLAGLSAQNLIPNEIFEKLAIEDIQRACDILRPIYDMSGGDDGFVSLEVNPLLAHNTEETATEARRLHATVGRENLLIKVPGTEAGLPAIETLLGEGINVNITLLFSLKMYGKVAEAYLNALEKRVSENKPVHNLFSVASFFVSRVDTAVDKLLEDRLKVESSPQVMGKLQSLPGKVAVSNARIAYQMFKEIADSRRFKNLEEKGARVQKLLWASTSTKNPQYRDVVYIEELIGQETINTMPQATIEAFKDHGRVRNSLEEDVETANRILRDDLKELGIDLEQITDKVLADGVKAFADSYESLMKGIESKIRAFKVVTHA